MESNRKRPLVTIILAILLGAWSFVGCDKFFEVHESDDEEDPPPRQIQRGGVDGGGASPTSIGVRGTATDEPEVNRGAGPVIPDLREDAGPAGDAGPGDAADVAPEAGVPTTGDAE